MDQLSLDPEDILIIIGDFINKGPDNMGVLKRLKALESQRPYTYILKGNHEFFLCHYLFSDKDENEARFLQYIKERHFRTLIHDCIEDGGFDLEGCLEFPILRQWLFDHYMEAFDYIHTRPAILFIDDLTFVHGGYSKDIDIDREEGKLLKYDDYNNLSDINEGTVIVGHWPTANLRRHKNTNRPYFNNEKKIITIDGGVGVKTSGELNALILENKKGSRTIEYLQENHFTPKTIIKEFTFPQEEKYFINYPHFDIEIIEKGDLLTLCRHVESGKELSIFNALLDTSESKPQVITTYINHFLNLSLGEEVALVMTYEDCSLVKHNGEFGWVWTWQLSSE